MGLWSRHLKGDEECEYELSSSSGLPHLKSSPPTCRVAAEDEKIRDKPPTMGLGAEEETWAAEEVVRELRSKSGKT